MLGPTELFVDCLGYLLWGLLGKVGPGVSEWMRGHPPHSSTISPAEKDRGEGAVGAQRDGRDGERQTERLWLLLLPSWPLCRGDKKAGV